VTVWVYGGEVVYYVERFDCKQNINKEVGHLLLNKIYRINEIDSLGIRGENTWIVVRAGDNIYFTHAEYPNLKMGCNESGCRISGGYHSSLTEDLIENF